MTEPISETWSGEKSPASACSGFFESWEPDGVSLALGTGYARFSTSVGIDGLAKYLGDHGVEFLALVGSAPGRGQLREFIAKAKERFQHIIILEVWNPVLLSALMRYGFTQFTRKELDGEIVSGWEWKSPNPKLSQRGAGDRAGTTLGSSAC